MRSRSEALAAKRAQQAEKDDLPASWNEKPSEEIAKRAAKVGPPPRLPLEDDASAMFMEIKKTRRALREGVRSVVAWSPEDRHLVAMWLGGQVEDVPRCVLDDVVDEIQRTKSEPRPGVVPEKATRSIPEPHPVQSTTTTRSSETTSVDSFSVSVGEEKYSIPGSYGSAFTVGSVHVSVKAIPGETPEQSLARARSLAIAEFARERDRKTREYLAAYDEFLRVVKK